MGQDKDKIEQMAGEVATGFGLEVLDVELLGQGRRTLLRITLDKPGGLNVGDCASFSRDMAAALDVEDSIKSAYTLEVSSPGLDRPLKEQRDFERHMGERVKVTLREKLGDVDVFKGTIRGAGEAGAVISADDDLEVTLPYGNILKARLEIKIK